MSNIRSDFLAAVKVSGLTKVKTAPKPALSRAWADLMSGTELRRVHIGLSRLARYASANGLEPKDIDDAAIERFVAEVRSASLHRKPEALHRSVASIWNELAKVSKLVLNCVTIPTSKRALGRIDWALLPASFLTDLEEHLNWCRGSDPFETDARERPLAALTVRLRRNQIHSAVTALVESGVAPGAITSLAALVSPEALKRILRRRLEVTPNPKNAFNRDLGAVLARSRENGSRWIPTDLTELKRLVAKMPAPAPGLTGKNKQFLRQFDDPEVTRRLLALPDRLWVEAKRDRQPGFRKLARAQAAIAVAMLPRIPIRAQNLTALTFDTHLFLNDAVRAVSTLELSADEVKNGTPMEFEIPPQIAKMMIEYRDRIAPKIIGHRPAQLFVNPDGSAKMPGGRV